MSITIPSSSTELRRLTLVIHLALVLLVKTDKIEKHFKKVSQKTCISNAVMMCSAIQEGGGGNPLIL